MKLVFMGTPDFSVPALQSLHDSCHEIVAVYTQPPRPAGRGKKEQKSAVHKLAVGLGLPVLTPKTFKDEAAQREFSDLKADCAVVVAYGQILPQVVLDTPRYGCVNIHASLLPRWRGAAPIHRAIMAGDKQTGVCIMQMEAGLDTGPVIMRKHVDIDAGATTAGLHDILAQLGAQLVLPALNRLEEGVIEPEKQPETGVTYAHKIDKAEAQIDWSKSAVEVDRLVRGLYPFPGAWTNVGKERIKVLAGSMVAHTPEAPAGTALDETLLVACGEGAYQIETAQRAGRKAMDRADFLRGFSAVAGTLFGTQT